jgi:hypothetical protein
MIAGVTTFRYNRETKAMDIIDQKTGEVIKSGIPMRDLQAERNKLAQVDVTATAAKVGRKQQRERVREEW